MGENKSFKWCKISDDIEICLDVRAVDKVEDYEPYNLLDLKYYYDKFLKDSEREKDQIKKIIITRKLNI